MGQRKSTMRNKSKQPKRKNRFRKKGSGSVWRSRAVFLAKVLTGAALILGTSGAFILAHDYFTQSDHFRAHQLSVTGQKRLTREQVLAIADIGPRSNILSVNLSATRKRLLADPWIAEATVRREIPAGLHIWIREEVPLAVVDLGDGQAVLINTVGNAFVRPSGRNDAALPTVTGLNAMDLPVDGRPHSAPFNAMMALLQLARDQRCPLARLGVDRIQIDRDMGATVHTGQGDRTVKFGFGHYREKCEALGRVSARLDRDARLARYRVVDLFDLNRIVITLPPDDKPGSDFEEVKGARS